MAAPPRPTGRVPFVGLTLLRCPGRLSEVHSHPGEPCPKLWKLRGPGKAGEGVAQACPAVSACISRAGARVSPREAPAISPCICQAPKTPSPFAHQSKRRLPGSGLRVPNSVFLLFALGSVSSPCRHWEPGVHPPRVAGGDPWPRDGQRGCCPGSPGLLH